MSLQFLPNINFLNKCTEETHPPVFMSTLLYDIASRTTMPLQYIDECNISFYSATMNGDIVDNRDEISEGEISSNFHFTKIGLYRITIQLREYDVTETEQTVVATLDCIDVDLLPQAYGTSLTSPIVLFYYNQKERSGNTSINLRLADSSFTGIHNIKLNKSNIVIEYLGK